MEDIISICDFSRDEYREAFDWLTNNVEPAYRDAVLLGDKAEHLFSVDVTEIEDGYPSQLVEVIHKADVGGHSYIRFPCM